MIRLLLIAALLFSSPAPASAGWVKNTLAKASGFALAFAVHEACHLATVKALGGNVRFGRYQFPAPYMYFRGVKGKRAHRAVAVAGVACTALFSEAIISRGKHKTSHIASGFLIYNAIDLFAYAGSKTGDAEYWKSEGGNAMAWRLGLYGHAARTSYILMRDWKKGLNNAAL